MKVLDRYIIRELLVPIVYASVALLFLILIADLFDNLEDLLRHQTPPSVILRYYASLVPYSFIQIIPWATWLGTLFLLVNFGFHNETLAMKAVGLKITSIIKPILFLGFLIGIATFLISDRVVPRTFRTANDLKEIYIENKKGEEGQKIFRNITYYSKGRELYFFRTFSQVEETVEGVVILWFNQGKGRKNQKMIAQKGRWTGEAWEFEGITEYQMGSQGRILGEPKTYAKKIYPEVHLTPRELASATSESAFLSYKQLKLWIAKLRENGVRVDSEIVDLQYRLASPWQGLIMMMITIPLLARTTTRKVIALNVLLCVALVFSFHVSGAVSLALGKAGKLFPFASAWAGNVLFAVGGLLTLERANF